MAPLRIKDSVKAAGMTGAMGIAMGITTCLRVYKEKV